MDALKCSRRSGMAVPLMITWIPISSLPSERILIGAPSSLYIFLYPFAPLGNGMKSLPEYPRNDIISDTSEMIVDVKAIQSMDTFRELSNLSEFPYMAHLVFTTPVLLFRG